MPFTIKASVEALRDFGKKSGYFSDVVIGEPTKVLAGEKLSAAVYTQSARVVAVAVNGGTVEVHTVTFRIYRKALTDPVSAAELELALGVQQLLSDILADSDLGATIRAIDVGGIYGETVGTEWGYVELGGVLYRVADITIPLIVDDSATAAQ